MLNRVIETPDMLARGRAYEAQGPQDKPDKKTSGGRA